MIGVALLLVGIALVAGPGLVRMPQRLPAKEWTQIAAWSLVAGFSAIEFGLASFAAPTLLRSLDSTGVASTCERLLAQHRPGGDVLGWLAAGALVVTITRAVIAGTRSWSRAKAAGAEPWLGRHEERGAFELVVLPTSALHAASVPSRPPQVQLSQGLVDLLDQDELDAVIRHEAAHLRHRHWRYRALAIAVRHGLSPLPPAKWSATALDAATEAWADETVASDGKDEQTSIRQALLLVGAASVAARASTSSVRGRASRLENGTPQGSMAIRLATHAPVMLLAAVAALLAGSWFVGVHHAWALGAPCS